MKNKRIFEKILIQDVLNNKELLKEISAINACAIGILANFERHYLNSPSTLNIKDVGRLKSCFSDTKSSALLRVKSKTHQAEGAKIITLLSKYTGKESRISTIDLCKNPSLIMALDPIEALALGYDLSDELFQEMECCRDL